MSAAELAAAVRSKEPQELALAVSRAHIPLAFHQLSLMLQCCSHMPSGVAEVGKVAIARDFLEGIFFLAPLGCLARLALLRKGRCCGP